MPQIRNVVAEYRAAWAVHAAAFSRHDVRAAGDDSEKVLLVEFGDVTRVSKSGRGGRRVQVHAAERRSAKRDHQGLSAVSKFALGALQCEPAHVGVVLQRRSQIVRVDQHQRRVCLILQAEASLAQRSEAAAALLTVF